MPFSALESVNAATVRRLQPFPFQPRGGASMHRTTLYAAGLLALAFATVAEERREPENPLASLQLGFLYEHHFGADRTTLQEQARWISESDLLVALQLRRQTRIDLERLIGWRRQGSSWDEITRQCGLPATVFFVQLPRTEPLRGPYVRPYSVWRDSPGTDVRLTDEEVRELVLLRTLRDFCQIPAAQVVRLRLSGRSPMAIAAAYGPQREGLRSTLQPPATKSHDPESRRP